ncbi:MAG: acetyl-CoA C-acyltransferase, partial [Acinetobacter sp.]
MSKTTQENPAVENSATETVSNTSKSTTRTTKSSGTAKTSANSVTKTTRTRSASPRKSTANTKKTESTTQTAVQQDKIMSQNTVRRVAIIGGNRIPFARSNGAYFT